MRHLSTSATLAGIAGAGLLLLSACGSSGGSSSASTTSGQSPTASSSSSGTVSVGTSPYGKVLVDPAGKTLYAFAIDSHNHSACTGSCLTYWPPVPGADAPHGGAAMGATFGTTKGTDGSSQLTVNGYPVYTYVGDSSPGQANGQGTNLSGGLWWVVAPNGTWVKSTTASSGSSPSSSMSGSSGTRGGY